MFDQEGTHYLFGEKAEPDDAVVAQLSEGSKHL